MESRSRRVASAAITQQKQFLEQETEIEFRFSRIIHAFCLIASLWLHVDLNFQFIDSGHEVGLRSLGLVKVPPIDLCLFFILHFSSALFDECKKRTVRIAMGTVNAFCCSPSSSSHVSTLNTTNINYSWSCRAEENRETINLVSEPVQQWKIPFEHFRLPIFADFY